MPESPTKGSCSPKDLRDVDMEELLERLKRWLHDPSQEPEIEAWYKSGAPHGIPQTVTRRPQAAASPAAYFPMYERARNLERLGKADEALPIYLAILAQFTPAGTVYYERPAILLERKGRYTEAISICRTAISRIHTGVYHADPEEFQRRIDRLEQKAAKTRSHK